MVYGFRAEWPQTFDARDFFLFFFVFHENFDVLFPQIQRVKAAYAYACTMRAVSWASTK